MSEERRLQKIRYITGRGGSLDKGLATYLAKLTPDFDGLACNDELLRHGFDEQLRHVDAAIDDSAGGLLIACSYGGYLLMHALVDRDKALERVLLLSPLLGRSLIPEKMMAFRPPRERQLHAALTENRVQRPEYIKIITGEDDPICCPQLARSVATQLDVDELVIAPGQGHNLDPGLVKRVISGLV